MFPPVWPTFKVEEQEEQQEEAWLAGLPGRRRDKLFPRAAGFSSPTPLGSGILLAVKTFRIFLCFKP